MTFLCRKHVRMSTSPITFIIYIELRQLKTQHKTNKQTKKQTNKSKQKKNIKKIKMIAPYLWCSINQYLYIPYISAGCVCEAGWQKDDCSEKCLEGFYGVNCSLPCVCDHGATCMPNNGTCICGPGYIGKYCQSGRVFAPFV